MSCSTFNTIKEINVFFLTTVLGTIFFFFSEIPNFLSDEECDHIIRLAESKQFISSVARGGLQSMSDFEIPEIRSKNQLYLFALSLECKKAKTKTIMISYPNTAWLKICRLRTKNGSV